MTAETFWVTLGLAGQAVFFARFVIQWIASERAKRSVVPIAFWYCSLMGAVIILVYAIHRRDPVFIIGQSAGFLIYVRNLFLIHSARPAAEQDRPAPEPAPARERECGVAGVSGGVAR